MSPNWNNWGPVGWPKPRPIVLEDRSTGTQYLLSHDSEANTIVLLTPVPAKARALPEEPLIKTPAGLRRLYVDDGELLEESETRTAFLGIVPAPLFTLNYNDTRTTFLIHGSGATTDGAPLCLKKYTALGLTTAIEDLGCSLEFASADVGILDTAGVGILDTAGVAIADTEG